MTILRSRRELLVGTTLLYVGGNAAAFWLLADWMARQTAVLALTGLVLIWYTWETMQLRRAAFAQRQLQLQPFVVLEPYEKGFSLRNLGQGVALNIKVDDVTISELHKVAIRFPKAIPVLASGETTELPAEGHKAGKIVGDFFLAHLDPQYATMSLGIRIHFQDVEMTHYIVGESVDPGKLRLTELSSNVAR